MVCRDDGDDLEPYYGRDGQHVCDPGTDEHDELLGAGLERPLRQLRYRDGHRRHTEPTKEGDYDGDGKADLTVYRPSTGTWFTQHSSTNYGTSAAFQWGSSGDIPVPG